MFFHEQQLLGYLVWSSFKCNVKVVRELACITVSVWIIDTSEPGPSSGHDAAAREETRGVQIQEENRASTSSTDDEEEAAKRKEQREAELRDIGETEQHAEPEDLLSAEWFISSLGWDSHLPTLQ